MARTRHLRSRYPRRPNPTYSYEDLVDGYRPRQDGSGFDLTKGPLLRIAEEGAAHPDDQYVLVIDELNRANVVQVFGELNFLLEHRNESVQLLYRHQPVELPPNLSLIATMNRQLAVGTRAQARVRRPPPGRSRATGRSAPAGRTGCAGPDRPARRPSVGTCGS
ncbi:AAA family ATPase [Amycolatopsis plumensis]|uniref:AAA family ATPase n=1 Tax=Amycolatopsis plumensis TaxID=236508 RepID=A0ABV5U3R0_9PSEU